MTENIKLRASSSERWINCPGSARLEHNIPETPSKYAEEGILAHELAAIRLKRLPPPEDIDKYLQYTGMMINVDKYVQYFDSIATLSDKFLLIERKVDFSHVLPDTEDPTGTCDALIIDDIDKTLHIIDLKYGKGVKVDVMNNTQLLLYALGAINDLEFLYDIEKIILHIVQPRLNHIDHDILTIKELESWKEFFIEKSQLALSENAPRIPSKKTCQFCKAKSICPEYQEAKFTFKPFTINDFDDLTLTNQEN